jgi:Zn-dependent protease with chaperone function
MPSAKQKSDRSGSKSAIVLWSIVGLGYAYILGIFVLASGFIYYTHYLFARHAPILGIAIYWLWIVAIAVAVYNFLKIEIELPPGAILDLQDPDNLEFKNLLTSLMQRIKARPIDRVIIDRQLNTALFQISRFGNFGKTQRYLVIGLPLLLALSPDRFKAVLARNLTHVSTANSTISSWLYNLVRSYQAIVALLQNKGSLVSIFIIFLNWYLPILESYTFALRREHEDAADRLAVNIAGRQNMAEALVALEIYRQFLDQQFWPEIFKNEGRDPLPPLNIFSQMEVAIANRDLTKNSQWLQAALALPIDASQTHQCLRKRLLALGYTDRTIDRLSLEPDLQPSAARKYLSKSLPSLVDLLGKYWQSEVSTQWQQKFNERQKAERSIERLTTQVERAPVKPINTKTERVETRGGHQDLTIDEFLVLAQRKIELGDLDGGMMLLYQSLELNPHHAQINLLLGSILLKMGNPHGIDYLETAMTVDLGLICGAISTIRQFIKTVTNTEAAELYESIATKHYLNWISNSHKYTKFKPRDLHRKHQISELIIEEVTVRLLEIAEIQHVYATLKSTEADLLEHHYLFVTYKLDNSKLIDYEDLSRLYIELEKAVEPIGICTIFSFQQYGYYECDPLIDKLRSIPKTCIYNRKKRLATIADPDR